MRIGVIGLGFMGTTHLQAWREVPDAQLAAVCSDDPRKLDGDLSGVQDNLGGSGEHFDFSGVARYTKAGDLLGDPDVDAVDICLPTHLHADLAIAALQAGKHTLVEKPMALDETAAERMLEVARRTDRVLMVAHVLRFLPAYRKLREEIQSARYGAVRSALFRRRCSAPFWNQWLGNPERSGGGVFDLLIHDVDYAVHAFGLPESVAATGYEDLPLGVDTITATLQYPSGLPVVIAGGWHHKKAYPFSMEFTVVMDGGTFEFNSLAGSKLTLFRADGEAEDVSLPEGEAFAAELKYFTECCTVGRRPAFCPPEESAESVKLTRLLLSARQAGGEPLRCPS